MVDTLGGNTAEKRVMDLSPPSTSEFTQYVRNFIYHKVFGEGKQHEETGTSTKQFNVVCEVDTQSGPVARGNCIQVLLSR